MNLLETLKQFKNIEPEASYSEKSRRMILASPASQPISARQIFVRVLETAGSLALAGVLIFAIAGGFSSSRYLSPVSFQGIDPAALHAEAEAIDMQITIANLSYQESANEMGSTAAVMTIHPKPEVTSAITTPLIAPSEATSTATSSAAAAITGSSSATSTSSTTFSINDALQQLEQ